MICRICLVLVIVMTSASCTDTPRSNSEENGMQSIAPEDTLPETSLQNQIDGKRPEYPDQSRSTHFSMYFDQTNSQQQDLVIREESDFKKASFFIETDDEYLFKLKDGVCDRKVGMGIDQLRLIEVETLQADGKIYHLVLLSRVTGGGSSTSCGILKIFEEKMGSILHEIGYILFADETSRVLNVDENKFTLHASIWDQNDSNCCPTIKEIGTFVLGSGLVSQSPSQFEWIK